MSDMANRNPSAAEKQWLKDITSFIDGVGIGVLYTGFDHAAYQRHHVVGKSGKNNKVHIGYWFILPVPFELHDVSSNSKYNVTHHKHSFTKKFGMQRDLFLQMLEEMRDHGYDLPPHDVCEAIRLTRV